MARPVKEFSVGRTRCAVFQNEYKGKTTYSYKFQKSYQKDGEWVNTDNFFDTDLRDLHVLVTGILMKLVKERTPKQAEPDPTPPDETPIDEPNDLPF